MTSTPTFSQARENEFKRQDYLDEFLKKNNNENVAALVYNLHKKPGLDKITEMQFAGAVDLEEADKLRKVAYESTQYAFLLITSEMIGKGNRHPIFVNPRAFNELNESDFEYSIVDHEYIHTHDFRFGIPFPNGAVINYTNAIQLQPVTLEAILDSRAYIFQLITGSKKGMQKSKAFINAINQFLKYHHILKNVQPENDFEREVINNQIASHQSILPEHLKEK